MQELVSIITPLYNAEKYVQKTADSVFSQTYQNWEWIIVDDCSKDDSLEVVKSFNDPRVRILRNEKNKGVVDTRNFALENVKGEFVAFLDSDDYWSSDKLEKQVSFMKEKGLALSFHSYQKFYDDGKMGQVIQATPSVDYKKMLNSNFIGCLTCMVKADKIGDLQMINGYKAREDWIFWLNILKNSNSTAYSLPDVLAFYRIAENSLSSRKFEMIKEQYRVYREVLKMNFPETIYYLTRYLSIGFRKYIK